MFTTTFTPVFALCFLPTSKIMPSAFLCQVAVGLWSVALLGRLVSGTDLLIAGFLLAFALPVLYTKFKKVVDKAVGDVMSQVQVSGAQGDGQGGRGLRASGLRPAFQVLQAGNSRQDA